MDLLERYLQAVGQYLPAARCADVLAELRSNLLERIDDLGEQQGHALNEAEIADVLRGHGRPALVAARYLPQRSLIGPEIFPFYWLALSRVLPLALVGALVWGAMVTGAVTISLHQLLGTAFTVWASVTLAFASVEAFLTWRGPRLPAWDPRRLPQVRPGTKRDSFANRLADAIVNGLFLAWLLATPNYTHLILGGMATMRGLAVVPAPEWHIFYWQLVSLMVAQFVLKVSALVVGTPPWRPMLDIGAQAFGVGVLAILVQAREYLVPTGAMRLPVSIATINTWVNLSFRVALVLTVGNLIWRVWKLGRSSGWGGRHVAA
jgi:hypothetical protein